MKNKIPLVPGSRAVPVGTDHWAIQEVGNGGTLAPVWITQKLPTTVPRQPSLKKRGVPTPLRKKEKKEANDEKERGVGFLRPH